MENQLNSTSDKHLSRNRPKCARCQNHSLKIDLRGHKRYCMYQNCDCSKCDLTVKRQKIMAQQTSFRRATISDETRMLCDGEMFPTNIVSQKLPHLNLQLESYNVCQRDSHVNQQLQQPNLPENFHQTSSAGDPVGGGHGQIENYGFHSNGKRFFKNSNFIFNFENSQKETV